MTPPPPSTPRRRWWVWWAVASVWWTLDGFTTATNYHRMGQGGGVTWEHAVRTAMWSAWLWVPLTVLAFWLADRLPLDRDVWRRHLPAHAAAAAAVCAFRAVAVVALNPWAEWYAALPPFREVLWTSIANNLFLFWMLVGVGHALVYARRARERDEQLVRAELHTLKMQLHPHFLFNTLNAVSAHVRTDPDTAERMIGRLGRLLRHALAGAEVQEVPLEEELETARAYLDIERVRFEDRLRVVWAVDPGALAARVPHLVLQPLVENAVRHGIAPRAAAGTVEVGAERRDGRLHLTVRDDGVGLPEGRRVRDGVGLANTRARLRQLYGARQSLDVVGAEGGGRRRPSDAPVPDRLTPVGPALSVLVADDEPPARRLVQSLLERHADVRVVGEAGSGREAVAAVRRLRPDVVFLDVQMPEGDGFDVVREVGPERMPAVVFATAYDEYAVRAFEAHAVDYLLKPFERDRFDEALGRARLRVHRGPDPRLLALARHVESPYLDRVAVRVGARIRLVDVADVDYFEAESNYVRVHAGPKTYLVRGTLAALEGELDPARFLRVHRSLVVGLDRVAEVEPLGAGEYTLFLRDGTRLTSGRTYRARVQEALRLRP